MFGSVTFRVTAPEDGVLKKFTAPEWPSGRADDVPGRTESPPSGVRAPFFRERSAASAPLLHRPSRSGPCPDERGEGDRPVKPWTARMPLILRYHSVDRIADARRPPVRPETFERQMDWLHRNGLRGVSVGELREARRAGRGRGLVGLTFDGGHACFATRAAPVLVRRGFTATVFVPAEKIGSDAPGPRRGPISPRQLRCMAGMGMEIGSHGLRHVSLPETDDEELAEELTRSRAILEEIIDGPVTGFAYPYGRVSHREVDAVRKAGYEYACAIEPSPLIGDHALPRTCMDDRDRGLRMWGKLLRHQIRWLTWV